MRIRFGLILLTLALASVTARAAQAEDLKVLRSQGDGDSIADLDIQEPPQIQTEAPNLRYVVLEGRYMHEGWTLMIGKVKLKLDADGAFKAKSRLAGSKKTFSFVAQGPDGETEHEDITLVSPKQARKEEDKELAKNPQNWFTLAVGVGLFSYSQDAGATFPGVVMHEKSLDARATYEYMMSSPHWSLDFGLTTTGLVINSDLAGYTARLITGEAAVSYHMRLGYSGFASLSGGGIYQTMQVTPNVFGFSNLSALTLGASAGIRSASKSTTRIYGSIAPVSISGNSYSSAKVGLEYADYLESGNYFPIFVEYSSLKTSLVSLNSGQTTPIGVKLSTVLLGIGYRF